MKKQFFVLLLVGLFAALTVSAVAWAQEGTQEAAVRVVHLVPNGPNVDIVLNGEAALQGLAAGTVSGYVSVPAGQYDVEVLAAGGGGMEPTAEVQEAQVEEAVPVEGAAVAGEEALTGITQLFDTIEQTIEGQDYQLAQDQIEEAQQALDGLGVGLNETSAVAQEQAIENLQSAQEALDTPDQEIALTALAQAREAFAQVEAPVGDVGAVGAEVGALGGANVVGFADETPYTVTGPEGYNQELVGDQQLVDLTPGTYTFAGELDGQPLERQVEVVGDQVVEVNLLDDQTALTDATTDATVDAVGTDAAVGVDQAVVQESLQAMPTLFATIRETINVQDYELAQDQIEEAQQLVQNVGGVGTEAVLPTLELVQEQLQTAQEALDEPDPVVALASIDEAEQTFGQLEGELGDAGVVTDAAAVDAEVDAAGVQEGAAIATATLTLEPGQYYTVVATQTQEALEGRINISATPGQAEINVTGPNGFAESFVGSRQLEALTPGNYIIAGTLVGYQSAQQQVEAQAGETLAADLTLEPLTQEQIAETPGGVTGGATGGAEAQAGAFPESPALVQLLVFQDSLDLPPAGQALVRIIHASPDAPAVDVVAQAAQEGDAVMDGAVTGGDEVAAGGMQLTLEPAEAVVTITGPDGYAEEITGGSQTLDGLVPGEYIIAATLEGYQPSETQVEVAPGEVVPVEILLEAEPQGESPLGGALRAFAPHAALLGLQLEGELEGYVSGAVTALEGNDLETAQQDLRAALLAVQAQLEGAEGETLTALQSTETSIQEALTALENDDTEGALVTLQTVQGDAAEQAEDTTGGAEVADTAQTGGMTGAAETGGAPADQPQVEGSVGNALAALEAGDVAGAQNELRAVLLVVQSDIETAEGDALVTLQETEASVQEALTALDADDQEGALTVLQTVQTGAAATDTATDADAAATGGAPAEAQAEVQGQTLVSGLSTGNASDYVAVPAGTYQLQVQTAEGGNVVLDIPDSVLEGGVVYTFYAFGSPTQGTLAINVSVDALVAQQIR